MNENGSPQWREVVSKHHAALADELSVRFDTEIRDAVSRAVEAERAQAAPALRKAVEEARQSQIESLNQVLRRLRTVPEARVLPLLAEGCAPYAAQLVVLAFGSGEEGVSQARVIAAAGVLGHESLSFELSAAPAVVSAIDSRDPVVALAAESEISPALAAAFGANTDKAYLFPVIARQTVMAMLVAAGVTNSAPLELLCEAAGMRMDTALPASTEAPVPGAGLVQLAGFVPASETAPARKWDDLPPADQKLHLQAQRMSRVRVAEMRLYRENELRRGIASGDIYSALQNEIDRARDQFLQSYLSRSSTMVDYLHLEILRSLAGDDDRVLGPGYPGPMV